MDEVLSANKNFGAFVITMKGKKGSTPHKAPSKLYKLPVPIDDQRPRIRSKFYRQTSVLIWKSYLQRQRRWRLLLLETVIGAILFLVSIFIARPVFLTPLQAEPEPPLATNDLLSSMHSSTLIGYAPNLEPYNTVMTSVTAILGTTAVSAETEDDLNAILYNKSQGTLIKDPIVWIIWKSEANNRWAFSIRSTERARYMTNVDSTSYPNPHLRAGFLAVQVAVSKAILQHVTSTNPNYEVSLVAMPVTPLMQEGRVRKALALILLCFTLAFLPAVLETEALVVWETENMFKRALRMRNVSYTSMYCSWMCYAYLTALPVCVLGAVTLILTFRWIHLISALVIVLAYVSVMTMVALIMAMFHNKYYIACIWTALFTVLQTYLAELLIHHEYDRFHVALTFCLHLVLPPLGLINAFNEFALLSTGYKATNQTGLFHMVASWGLLILIYFGLLMILQRTIGHKAIGGQVSWRSIIFKKAENRNELHKIENPSRSEKGKLQEVDEFVAIAISFKDVCKNIMGVDVVKNLTFDLYRGEYTLMYGQRNQHDIIHCLDDLMTGLTSPDYGEIRMLGEHLTPDSTPLNKLYMMGYCHRSESLIDDLTVQEHFSLFTRICLWHQAKGDIMEYGLIRYKTLIDECNLTKVRHTRVRDLDIYYKAQLCWALAKLLEPRAIMIPIFKDEPTYRAVITDKITKFRKHITIIAFTSSSLQLEYADRIFVFDSKILAFGGTPAYMFFRYGREYRVRLTLRSGNSVDCQDETNNELLERARAAGATVRAHLGSLLILRLPAIPTAPVAELIKDFTDNSIKYGLTPSIHISVPDSEEIVRRAITESRAGLYVINPSTFESNLKAERTKAALRRIAEPVKWKRRTHCLNTHIGCIAKKFVSFHMHHRTFFILTLFSALISGLLLGLSISTVINEMNLSQDTAQVVKSEKLTVEFFGKPTYLVLRSDNFSDAISLGLAYTMSDTKATKAETKNIFYIAMPETQSLIEYLMTRAIDSPQRYVFYYAYGIDISRDQSDNISLSIEALYSPLHQDRGAAARSLARVYTSLIRHYTGQLDATIQVFDDPLTLDLSVWTKDLSQSPLFLQFLLILTISHITFLPSMEFGFVRHVQKHAMNFSPFRYWLTLYFCDIILFLILVGLMTMTLISTICISTPVSYFQYNDLLALPFVLLLYGMSCIPQAYVFSLGPRVALNAVTFVIVNLILGETTIIRELFHGEVLSFILDFMCLSPQFNMAYAYVKIRQIILHNTECDMYLSRNVCTVNTVHKCCSKCGILEECFKRRDYFTSDPGILTEVLAMFITAIFFSGLLLLIEYNIFKRVWRFIFGNLLNTDKFGSDVLNPGIATEKKDVIEKKRTVNAQGGKKSKEAKIKMNTFGEYLCATNLTRKDGGQYTCRNIYLGLGKGEALAVSGLNRHGKDRLCEILAGYKLPNNGNVWTMSKWNLINSPHQYCCHISLSCDRASLPSWLSVTEALILIASLRGVPIRYATQESKNLMEALDISHLAHTQIRFIEKTDMTRVHFAAAVIGAPPVIILDEVTAWQRFSVRRVMFSIIYVLRKRGHAILITSSNIESHISVASRLAIMIDGAIYDVDTVDRLVERYSHKGYTIVVHLMDDVDVENMFSRYFNDFAINDVSEVLVNVQVMDPELTWKILFQRMEAMQSNYYQIYTYIATSITIDYIYNSILFNEHGLRHATGFFTWKWAKKIISSKPKTKPQQEDLDNLKSFERKYSITTLKDLPWSVIFDTTGHPSYS